MSLIHSLRALIRFAAFLLLTLVYTGKLVLLSLFKGQSQLLSLNVRRQWAVAVLGLMGVKLTRFGNPPEHPVFLISNHRSYLDPIVVLRDALAMPVSKAEVSKWPVIGYSATLTGILFVERHSKMSRVNTLKAMSEMIRRGFSILLYPEGTTHEQPTTTNFKGGAFRIAASEQIEIVPVAIDYKELSDSWIGDETFITHFFRTFGRARTEICISYGQPLRSDDHLYLMTTTRKWIDEELLSFRKAWNESAPDINA